MSKRRPGWRKRSRARRAKAIASPAQLTAGALLALFALRALERALGVPPAPAPEPPGPRTKDLGTAEVVE